MSGFLQRLAQRESGALAVMNPRLASWFEPQPAQTGMAPAGFEPEQQDSAVADAPAVAPTAPAAPLRPAPAQQQLRELSPPPRRMAAPEPMPAAPKRAASPERHDSIVRAASAAPPAPPLAMLQAAPKPRAEAAAPLPVPPPARQETGARSLPALLAKPAQMRPAAADRAPVKVAPQHPAAPSPALQASLVRMAPAALLAARTAHARREPEPAAAPRTIEVTIGRLEVRAHQGVQPAPAARAKQSPTSLDEYLARRNGEVRR